MKQTGIMRREAYGFHLRYEIRIRNRAANLSSGNHDLASFFFSRLPIGFRKSVLHPFFQHRYTVNTFITSSPKWLITFTAMRPVDGRGNGREVSRYRVAQASSSISAFRAVFRLL